MPAITEVPDSSSKFSDNEFMANNKHVADQWASITELYPDGIRKSLLPDTFSRDQFSQGKHYECFMQSTLSTLVRHPDVIRHCFVTKKVRQDGRYTFQFFRGKEWVKVEIDDRIALEDDDVLYCQSPTEHWWPLLLEKAYAKFYTSYDYLDGCSLQETYHDLTSHPVLNIPLQAKLAKSAGVNIDDGPYWLKVGDQIRKGEYVSACMTKDGEELESIGMQTEQQYAILDIFSLTGSSALSDLVIHLHNPFEDDVYTGALNGKDKTWTAKQRAQYNVEESTSIFMPFPNFKKLISSIQLCFMSTISDEVTYFSDEWKGESAGGNPTCVTWRKNPLFLVNNTGPKDLHLIVTISQDDQRAITSPDDNTNYVQCGLVITRNNAPNPTPTLFVTGNNNKPIYKSLFLNSREVSNTVTLPSQSLCYLVPSTMAKGTEAPFLLSLNYYKSEDYSNLKVEKLTIDSINWKEPAQSNVKLSQHDKDRVDFYVDCETDIHILLHQDVPATGKVGNAMTESYMGMYLYDDTDRRIGGVHAATNFREISIIHHLTRSGRYAISLTCPRSAVEVPATVTVSGIFDAHARIVAAPDDATMFDDEDVIDEGGDEDEVNPIDWEPINFPESTVEEVADSNMPYEDKRFYTTNKGASNEAWMHIGDLYPEGKTLPLLPDKLSRDQFSQGENFECCALTIFAGLVDAHPDVIKNCFVTKNPRKDGRYTFQFHRYGQWMKVEIDDRIPCIDGNTAFCRSPTHHWWPVLLEKAYAKFYTLYQNLEGCTQQEVFHDFTGRPVINLPTDVELAKQGNYFVDEPHFWYDLKSKKPYSVFSAAASDGGDGEDMGLLEDQYYAILDIIPTASDEDCELNTIYIKLYNPYEESPYTGPMNQNDPAWNPSLKAEIGADEKNVFVMTADVFLTAFKTLQQGFVGGPLEPGWHFNSEWGDETNGGNPMLVTWRLNPLYVARNTSDEHLNLITMVRQPDQRHILHTLPDDTLEYPRKGITVAQAVPTSASIPTYLVTYDNHKLIHKGMFHNSREVCEVVTVPAKSLCYMVGSFLQNEKSKFIFSFWYLSKKDASAIKVVRYQPDVCTAAPAEASLTLENRGKERIDFLVDCATPIHILLSQEGAASPGSASKIMTPNFLCMYLFDSNDKMVKSVPSAMCFRELSIVEKLPAAGRYAVLLTCPKSQTTVPCKVNIVGLEASHVRITDTPENAGDLNAVDLSFLDQDPLGIPLAELPLSTDKIFQDKLDKLRKLLADPNADPDEIQRLKDELNQRIRELAAALIGSERPIYLKGRDLDTLNPLLDDNDEYMAKELERYKLKQDPRSVYKVPEQEEKLRAMADEIMDNFLNSKLDFIDEEPEGIPVEDIPLTSNADFEAKLKKRNQLKKDPEGNAAEISALEHEMNEIAHEMAKDIHTQERFYLDKEPEHIPLAFLPLNTDEVFKEKEKELRALNKEEHPDKGKINQLQKELNDRAHELAKDLKEKERNMFLSSKFAGIPASELNLDDNPEFHALELERLALRQEDATGNEEKIRDLERRMNDAAEELAKEKVQDERAFLKELGFDMDVLNAVLDKDPDFLAKEARLRELMKDPVGNASEINALKEEMAADAKRLLDAHKEGERGSYLKSEYEGHPTSTLPLGEDKEFSELEDAYLKLKNDPNASPEELQRLRDALDKRAAEIARDLNVKDRASYLQANYRGILTGALPLDADEEFKKLEQERARIIAKGGDPSEINARLDARADEIAKQMIVGDRAYLNPVQAGVPLELVPLDESEAFLKGEEERFHLKKTALDPSSVKLKERELNTLVEGIAAEMKENERKSFLDDTYNNVPRSALPLDTDEKFKTAEIDRLRAKKDGDADKVKSLEDLMKKRAQELAKSQKEGDRAFIHKLGLPVSGDLLDKILDNNKEFMDLESKLRALKKNPTANAREIKELEDKMAKLAGAAVVAYLDEERKGFLKSEYHGRPTETLPLTEDPEFKKLEAEYQALKNQPNPDRAKLKELEDKMNQRADEIARGLNEADRAGFLGDRIRGIPIASLPLEDDAAFKALEEQRAALLNDPSKADEVKKLEQKLRDRADEIAKAKLADDRAFLDNEPEGIPLACIELDKDPEFADKEEQRASLMADNHNGKNAKAIAALEDNMNQHAHARAKKLKEDHLKACVDGTVRGIPTDVLGLADDAECTKLIGQRAAALLEGDQEKAKALGAALNERAHDLMDKRIDEIRSQLTPEQLRIPLSDLDLDSDEKYKKLEAEAAALMKDPKKNADQLKSLFNKMNSRAAELADEKAWKEREQYLTSDYEGRDLHALPLNSDDQFLALEKERREALKAGDTARAKELEDKLSARATDIARKLNADERAAFLGNAIRGVPLSALNLDDDEDFRKLESQRQTNKRSRGIGNEAVEESLRNRAEALAAEKLKSDRAFLDERPEGVLLRQVPIDDDPKFKQLEEKRAKLNSQGGSGDVKGLEDQMNRRAHELAALIKDSTRADLEQKPLSVALRDLPLDSDDTFVDLEEKYRDAKNGDSASLQDDLLAQLNDRAKELAQELHDKERRGLNQNPEGIPLSAINVNDDPLFVNLETDARSLRAKQPDSSKLKDLEKQLDARASELAHKVRKEYITGDPEGIPIEMLNLGNEPAFLKKEEERRRLLESDPAAAAKLTAELNEMACGIAKQKMTGDRDFLDQNPEGVPIDILPLDTDPKFHELELERAKLRGENATKNATKIKSLEGKMNERLHELAKEQKREDLKGLDQAPRGIPLETLNPHEDPEFAAMVNQLREYKKEPSLNADHIKKLQEKMNERCSDIAKDIVLSDRKYLDENPEGVPLPVLRLDEDPVFSDLESQRANLKALDAKRNASSIKQLEDQLNQRAHELAKARKANELEGLNQAPRDIPIESLKPFDDAEFAACVNKLRELDTLDPSDQKVAALKEQMNARAEALADAALNGDRDYLVANPKGVPLDILPLDTDPTFHAAEVKRAVLKAENARRNADKIKELEDQLNLRAIELAEERRQKDLEGIDEKPNGVPLEVLDPHSDPQFAEMVEKRRELEKDPSQAAALAALVDSMNQRAQSLAKNMVESDRGYLDKDPEGVSLEVLPLDTDETFKKLESKRAVLKAQDPRKNKADIKDLETQLNDRAHELARNQKKEDMDGLNSKPRGVAVDLLKPHEDAQFAAYVDELRSLKDADDFDGVDSHKAKMNAYLEEMADRHMDRDYLDQEPEGVELCDVPLDEDSLFQEMEAERATLKLSDPRRNADKIKSLQRDLNNRAHELAKGVKEDDLSAVDDAPKGVPKESLYLHQDETSANLIKQLRNLKKNPGGNKSEIDALNRELNERAHELAEQLTGGDRGSYMDPKPLGIPLAHLPLETDEEFKDLEVERAKLKASDPKANAAAIKSTEALLNERAKKLAREVMADDLKPFKSSYDDIPTEDLQPHNDKVFAGAAFQKRQNKISPTAMLDDDELLDIMDKRLVALANEKKNGDMYFLNKTPEGVPLEDIPYLTDSNFQSMKAQREKLRAADAFENREAIEKLEKDMNDRVRDLALDVLKNDFAKVNQKPMGIPLELLRPREDEEVKKLVDELRRVEMTPALKSRAAGISQKIDDRVHALAREALEKNRDEYLDDNPEGVPLSILPLNTEPAYHDLDVKRAIMELEDPVANAGSITSLQEKLNEKAHELALEQKEEDLSGVDKKPLGVPLELLKPHQDSKMATMINEIRVLKNDPVRFADKIRTQQAAMNDRAHELARNVLEGDRGYLGNEILGVPVADLPLDTDPTFHNLEIQRAAEKSKKSDSRVAKDLEQELYAAAEDLAKQQRQNDLTGLNPKPLGVPLALLKCHDDDRFASNMSELRRLAKDPSRNAAKLKSLRDKLDDRNFELAEEFLKNDRASYLDATPEGIPFALLPLSENEEFKDLENKKLSLQNTGDANRQKVEEMEKQLNLLAHEIALDQLKKDRDYLDQTPEGVPVGILPLDTDEEFRKLEAKRAEVKAKNAGSQEIPALEEKLNARAHELAKLQIQEDLHGLNQAPRGIPIDSLKPHSDPIFAQMVDDLRAAKSSASSAGAVADLQEKMNDRLDQMADNVLNNDRAYLPAKLEGIPVSRLPLDTDPSFHAMEVERAQLKLGDAVKNGSKIKELESELCQRAKELAKELKAEDLHGLTQAPRGIPLEILNLHKDAKCASMLEEKSKLVKSRSVDADPVVQSLNSMAEQMADGLLKGDREYLDREPEGVPIAELAVDDDKVFHDMEVERAVLKATNPVKNATTILELEDQLNARAHELAQQALEKDRHYLDPNPEGVPLDVLPLDSDSKFHQMEVERARQKRKGNDARVKELEENLNKRSHELAKKQLEDDLVGLDKEPEGYPIALLNLHNDEEFKALIPKLREAKKQNDMSAVRSTQSKLNDRSHEVAKDKILNDRAELERRPDGVPLELLPLDTDSQFKALEKELRTQKSVPKNDNVVSETVNKLNKRALDLAKDLRLKNRAFLDPEPEGIPIDDVPLDADEPFKNLEVERLRLLAAPNKSSKKAELSDLEEKLNKRAREVAAATKTEDRGFLKDSSYGIPKELIALDTDKEFNRTEKDLRRTLKHPERNTTHSAEDLKDKLQQRADEIALQQLRGGRDKYLDVQPGGVDLVDLPLDTDEEFGKLELERALAVARQDPSSTINDLEKKLNERAHALAVKVVDDDREFLPREIKNIAIEELPLSTDDKFKKLERQRRQHKRACKMDAVLEDEELLRQRANELAEDVIDQDLAPLKQCYRGIPTKELNLHVDEKFRDLANKRRRKRGQGRVKAVDMVAIEDEMDKRACEIADDLINEERGFLDQEPEGMHIMDVPLDDDPTFVQLEAEYRRRSKDPRVANMNKEVLRELCTELNQRSHALARNEFVKRREFMEPEPEGVPLYELGLDEDPEFKEAEIALYKNSKNSTPSPHVATEMQDRMSKRAQELARQILASDRDFLDPEPEGVQLSELPLDSDQTFGDLARERRRKKKNLQRGTGEAQVSAIEEKMNERSHELARTFLNAERAFLEPEPEGVPLADLPLNSDAGFRALEKERLKMKRDPSSGPSAIGGIEATLNDRCKQVARNLLNKERAFLDKEPMGVPLEDLPLNHDDRLNPVERRRRQLRKDPKRNQEEIRKCEDQMADRVNEIATEFIEKERAFMDQEPEGVPLRYLPLGTDKEFRELERQRRDQLQQPTPNQKTITQLEARMNERGHLLAKDLVEKGRSFLDPEPLGVPIADVPLNGDEQFRKMEEQRRSLKQDPRNAATVKALEERLNDRAYELAQQLLDKERAFMDQNPLDIPLSDLPLNQDLRMREIERTRRLLSKDNASGKHDSDIAVLGEGMAARSVELAKRTFEEERLFLNPEPCGVPLSDLPLFEDPEFHSKELERLKLRKKKQSSEKIRTLEADLNNRAKELAEEFIRKERAYLDQNPEGIPLERLPLDKDPVFHDMELERRAAVRSGADPNRVASLEDRLNQRVHELAMEIRGWQDKEFFDANSHVAPKWPRIGELFPEGRYDPVIPDEVSAGDVLSAPGDVGYLSPFIAALSRHPVLLKRLLVTEGHPVNAPYTFLFFDPNSNPVYVDVDDRVPCNANMEPMFVQSVNRYWYPLLLEKAYAKFVGGYEKLDNCTPHETLRDLTGRPVTHAPFDAKLAEAANIGDASTVGFWRGIADDISRGDIVLCMSNGEGNMDGIHPQCSYALIGLVETVSGSNNPADMVVKLHNPYNHYSPFYNGPLELNDPNWTEDLRRACRYDANRDDILYLPLPVFLRDFSSIQRCHINCGDRLTAAGAWDNNTAGGNPKFTSFRNNPIYLVENKGSRPTTILTEVRHSGPLFTDPDGLNHYPQTGIALMQPIMTSTPPTPLITNSTHRFLQKGMMLDSREVCSIMELPPNSTCYLIPYTMKANQMGSFNISVYPGMAKVTLTPLHFAGLSREPATTKVKAVPGEDGVRVDFMLSDPTTVHIILHQDKVTDQKTVRKGDAIAEDDVIFTVFDEQGIRCATTSEATNAREHSLAFKASQAGRYSLLVTVPNTPQTGDAPCTLSIYTPKRVTVKFVAPPAGARPLQQTRLPTLNRAATTAAKTTRPTGRSRRASSANDRNAEALPPISGRGGKKRSVSQGVSKKKNTESARF